MSRQPLVLVISFSDLTLDPRVDRQIDALRGRYRVAAAGFGPPRFEDVAFTALELQNRTMVGRIVNDIRLVARRFQQAYWTHPMYLDALERLQGVLPDVVVANDIAALPLALRLRAPVVFDAHEFAPAQFANRIFWRALFAPYVRWLCTRYMPQAAETMTVGESIADLYERDVGVRPTVVTNAPRHHDLAPTDVHEPIRVLHHGQAKSGRGFEEMLRIADLLDERFVVDFVLTEDSPGYRTELMRRAADNPRVGFPPARPAHDLVAMANDYDIGLYLLPPVNLNHRYALPNKLFEFIQARLAVAVGPSPEMARIVSDYGCGVVASDFQPETLARALNDLDTADIAAMKLASNTAAHDLSAEVNANVIVKLVDAALAPR